MKQCGLGSKGALVTSLSTSSRFHWVMKKIKAHNIPQEVLTRYRNGLWSQPRRILGPSGLKPWHLHSHLVTYVRTPLRAQTLRSSRTAAGLHNHMETKLPSTAIMTESNTLDKNFTVRWRQHFENFHDISRNDIFSIARLVV